MALKKKYQTIEELLVYPSLEPTIEVIRYRAQMCAGFVNGKTKYVDATDTIQFVHKHEDGKRWLLDTKGTPIRDTVIGEWVDSKAISFDYLPDLPPIFREMFYFYAGEQRWEDEPVEIPPLGQFIKDVYSRKDEYGNKFKYFVFKIEDLANALGECRLREFFDITERYNEYRANHRGKAPGKYWVINRDEVPEIKSFEEFKKKVTE